MPPFCVVPRLTITKIIARCSDYLMSAVGGKRTSAKLLNGDWAGQGTRHFEGPPCPTTGDSAEENVIVRRGVCTLLILFFVSTGVATAVPTSPTSEVHASYAAANVDAQQVYVGADPRIELMSVVQVLAGYFLVTPYDSRYKQEVEAHFGRHANHRAVTLFKELSEQRFNFSTVPDIILRYTPPPALQPRVPVPSELSEAAGGPEMLASFVNALRDFAVQSDFKRFYAEHELFYTALASRSHGSASAVVAALERYTGSPIRNGRVILAPLLHDGGFAAFYDMPEGSAEAWALIGPNPPLEGIPWFGDATRLEDLIGHEFGHLIVNTLTEAHADAVAASEASFPAVRDAMYRNGYSNWKTTVDEHIIHAITSRLAASSRGEAAAEAAVAESVKRGFLYVPALVARLKRYESQRERYPTLASFYPELLEAFAERAAA